MLDPILHGTANGGFLPEDHWLNEHWPEHDEGTDTITCTRCNHPIYSRQNGTSRTWLETGFVLPEEEGWEVHLYCIHCAAHMDGFNPIVHPRYQLNDDGSPQWDGMIVDRLVRWGPGIDDEVAPE